MASFVVLSLPRSRSAWLSHFLSYRGTLVGHDMLAESESLADFEHRLAAHDGSCETAAMVGWRLLRNRLPSARLVVVKRPVDEVVESIRKKGFLVPKDFLLEREALLDALASQPGVLCLQYDWLDGEAVCKEIFEFCLRRPFDHEWWDEMRRINIQIDLEERMGLLRDRAPLLAALHQEVADATAALDRRSPCKGLN